MLDLTEYSSTNRLNEMAVGERPQERLERQGPAALSDTELLAMLVRNGTRGQDVMTLTTRLIAEAGSLSGLLAWRETEFRKFKGVGRVKALQLVAAMEVARRVIQQQTITPPQYARTESIIAYFEPLVIGLKVEKFWVMCMDRKNHLLKRVEITSGSATSTLAPPREVLREAIREAATAIVCVHNHPSGDPAPSQADHNVTRQIREASYAVGIDFLDHLIIGRKSADPRGKGYYSFREHALT